MPSGRKPTCDCGSCQKCRERVYKREWARSNPQRFTPEQLERKRAYQREYGKTHDRDRERMKVWAREYKKRHPEKNLAHRAVTYAIRRGEIQRGDCEVCGAPNAQGHHDDYDKPLDVRWLCPQHHADVHRSAV